MLRWACLTMLAGCGIARVDFAAEKASALCDLTKRCQLGGFYVEYTSMDNCLGRTTNELEDEVEDFELCSFDPAEAARCTRRIRSMSCGDFGRGDIDEPCDLVFDCGYAQ